MKGGGRVIATLAGLLGLGLMFLLLWYFQTNRPAIVYGATFSPSYAKYLGLDARKVLDQALTELPIEFIRLPVEWNRIQPHPNEYQFADLDSVMNQVAGHHKQVILTIGNKVPRWPECYTPTWASTLTGQDYDQALLTYVEAVVRRYHDHPALLRWQVENETLFRFGECPDLNYALLEREVSLVRELDPKHAIQLTVSGEQQIWASLSGLADIVGASMYRQVSFANGFRFTFPIPAQLYRLQTLMVSAFVDQVVISELQAEPWLSKDYRSYSPAEAAHLFTPQQLGRYLRYARSTGLREISLWGIEWWYYLREHDHPELWDSAKILLR